MSYEYYICRGGFYYKFIERNPEFDCENFENFVIEHNKADRDSGELGEIAKHEILRLAYEYSEYQARFPNVFGKLKE